jgi:NADH dehydrogenase (ubiquinone) 1 beta subcomplex subunit 9
VILEKAEEELARKRHPDPYIPATFPGGTKWERNLPPTLGPIFDHEAHH